MCARDACLPPSDAPPMHVCRVDLAWVCPHARNSCTVLTSPRVSMSLSTRGASSLTALTQAVKEDKQNVKKKQREQAKNCT